MFKEPVDVAFPLAGGLDYVTPGLLLPPGKMLTCENMEIIGGKSGYYIPAGYERCTDNVLPSETNVFYFVVSNASGAIAIDDSFTDGTRVVKSLVANDSPQDSDVIVVASHDSGFVESSTFTGASETFDFDNLLADTSDYTKAQIEAFNAQAIEQTRSAIPEVSGSGDIHGGFRREGVNYVFRGTGLYKGTSYGWTAVTMDEVIHFDGGLSEFDIGETITNSSASAVVVSMTKQSGAWDGSATGYITVNNVSGTITDNVQLIGTASVVRAVANGVNSAITLPNSGKYETKNYNFTNLVNNTSTYGVNGTGPAFEFDGTSYIPILNQDTTVDAPDVPYHINIHQERTQLVYPGGIMAYGVSGDPRAIANSDLYSGTYSTGSEITGIKTIHGNAAIIFTNESAWMLMGDGVYTAPTHNWTWFEFGEDIGAIEWSISAHGSPVYMSGSGIYQLTATETSGGFASPNIAEFIQPLLDANKSKVVGSLWVREKSQYRVFFSDGYAVYIAFNGGQVAGATKMKFPCGITNVWSEVEGEKQYMFFTSDDGYLYRMDSGGTFDTDYIEGSFRTPFYKYGSSRIEKLFDQMIIEFSSPSIFTSETEITFTTNHNYGSLDSPRPISETLSEVESVGGYYGDNAGYGNFAWSGPVVSEIQAYLDGYGANMSMLLSYKTKYTNPFAFLTVVVDFIELGRKGQA